MVFDDNGPFRHVPRRDSTIREHAGGVPGFGEDGHRSGQDDAGTRPVADGGTTVTTFSTCPEIFADLLPSPLRMLHCGTT
jgi:hypothetical protein